MERNHIIGFILIFATLLIFNIVSSPSKEELARSEKTRDSLEMVKKAEVAKKAMATGKLSDNSASSPVQGENKEEAITTNDTIITLENDDIQVNLSGLGGKISSVKLKKYFKVGEVKGQPTKSDLLLLEDKKNVYNLTFGNQSTANQVFRPVKNGNKVDFVLNLDSTRQIIQSYTLSSKGNTLDYAIHTKGIKETSAKLNWVNYLDKIEKGYRTEQQNSTIYYKESTEDNADYCSCTANDNEKLTGKKVNWVANTNQFFTSTLISKAGGFSDADLTTELIDFTTNDDQKKLITSMTLPLSNGSHEMQWYIGPNDFKTLQSFNIGLEEIIPYGSSIFGSINRWVIRPFFDFLNTFVSSKGIAIILVIFLIKMMLYPLLYKMLHSQAKMAALKPELSKIKDKHKEDLQKQQVESMKVYQEFGVSPFAGCLPMVLQMPIWIALYRFFRHPSLSDRRVFFGRRICHLMMHFSIYHLSCPSWVPTSVCLPSYGQFRH